MTDVVPTERELRRCNACTRPILWTVTQAGARMAVDPKPDECGNQACYRAAPRTWHSRSLDAADALPPAPWETRHIPHVATCKPKPPRAPRPLPEGVIDIRSRKARP